MSIKDYSAEVIAQSFIKQYYELMSTNKNELYRFYKEDSIFTHAEGSQAAASVNGTEKIRACVRELDVGGARFNLADGSVDAHKAANNDVFVLVTGFYTARGSDTVHQFVQSFFLAVQSDSKSAYYVRNSVFRLLHSNTATTSTGVSTATAPATVSTGVNPAPASEPAPDAPAPLAQEVATPAAPEPTVAKEAKKGRSKKESPPPRPEPTPEPEMIMDSVVVMVEDVTGEVAGNAMAENMALQQIGEQLAELASEAVSGKDADTGPKSYADLFKRNEAAAPAQAATNGAPGPKKGRSTSGGRARSEPAVAKSEAPAPSASKVVSSSSLYVRQLPADITEADLLSIFVGASKVDIHAKGYGFIEFPEPVFAASTLTRYQEDPSVFSRNGIRLRVEERTVQAKNAAGPSNKTSVAHQGRNGRDNKPADSADAASGKQQGKGGNRGPKNAVNKGDKGWNVQGNKK